MAAKTIRIGGASGFWGDSTENAAQLVHRGNIDYLVFDYLAEVTMSILQKQKERDPNLILDHVRYALRRQLCHHVSRDGLIQAVLLSPEVEEALRNATRTSSLGDFLELDPHYEQQLLDNLAEMTGAWGTNQQAPVVVTTADIRRQLRKLVEDEFFSLPVFSFSELSQHYKVQPVGMLEV